MKGFAKKVLAMFTKELMKKIQSDEFESLIAQSVASRFDLKGMTEEEEIAHCKKVADCATDSVAVLMGGKAD
ncbi:MAG: hypothetical protein Unbinned6224contig1001_46 [Prokaryotic dsDNA virus sp.]|nr:MAG: hypothetical protein Unbinned6224contig1001_46 [Prokaryotic dsDNA virus sp.]|tara:strand:- start:11611 stop:11826 length:216 start_codon:yes stop_codon:yes gene_type:complete